MKPGYLYVLVHPSDPDLYKVGVTILHPEKRLVQHNRHEHKYAGKIAKDTGQKWELKTYIAVPDPYWAERAFWGATPLADIPYLGGIEVQRMQWRWVEKGLDAARKARARPPPAPVPDHVLAYTAWMNKRLAGRGITLLGHVRSKFGRSNFRCSNGHEWRAVPNGVAEGEGCPQCGIGKTDPIEIERAINPAFLCMLVHPDKPGLIRIELAYSDPRRRSAANVTDGWELHRYRYCEEPAVAEALIWELLGHARPNPGEPIGIELSRAEQAFRELTGRVQHEIALLERAKEHVPPTD